MDQQPVLTLTWPAIAGSGFVATLLFLALVERLRRTFATRAEVEALRALAGAAREAADEARERATAAQREQRHQWERVADQLMRPQERMADKLAGVGEEQAAQAAALSHALQRLDRLEAGPAGGRARRRA